MPNIQKLFLKNVKQDRRNRFPFLKAVELNEVPKRGKNCTFVFDNNFAQTGVVFFIAFQFSKIRLGEFTIDVSISNDSMRSVLERRWREDLPLLKIGSYRIGTFLNKNDFWWALCDADTESVALLQSFGEAAPNISMLPPPDRWRPSSFSLLSEQIVEEAISNVNETLRTSVLTELKIEGF